MKSLLNFDVMLAKIPKEYRELVKEIIKALTVIITIYILSAFIKSDISDLVWNNINILVFLAVISLSAYHLIVKQIIEM